MVNLIRTQSLYFIKEYAGIFNLTLSQIYSYVDIWGAVKPENCREDKSG